MKKYLFIVLCVIFLSLVVIISSPIFQLRFYMLNYRWESALSLIEENLEKTMDASQRDELTIYKAHIYFAMYKASSMLISYSQAQLNPTEKAIYLKYKKIYDESIRGYQTNCENLLAISQKNVNVTLVYRLPKGLSPDTNMKFSVLEADDFFRKSVDVFLALDFNLEQKRSMSILGIKVDKGIYSKRSYENIDLSLDL